MSKITDAVYIPAKCEKTKKDFFIVYYKAFDGTWVETYGKASLPNSGAPGSGEAVSMQLDNTRRGPQYSCPHCGQKRHFRCPHCGQWTCWDGDDHEGRTVWCAHCGKSGVFSSRASSSGGPRPKGPSAYSTSGQ